MNLYGRLKTARANRNVSWSAGRGAGLAPGGAATDAPQTAHWLSPPPTMEPQLRHMVGRRCLSFVGWASDKSRYVNKRDAFIAEKHHAQVKHQA
ncbi:MAG: hypothetical protein ACRD6N_01380 [Pyrinomonadaceae bacterium]